MHYPIIALMRGSHGLSARRAWRTLSSRPEGPQSRAEGPQPRSRGPESPKTSIINNFPSLLYLKICTLAACNSQLTALLLLHIFIAGRHHTEGQPKQVPAHVSGNIQKGFWYIQGAEHWPAHNGQVNKEGEKCVILCGSSFISAGSLMNGQDQKKSYTC